MDNIQANTSTEQYKEQLMGNLPSYIYPNGVEHYTTNYGTAKINPEGEIIDAKIKLNDQLGLSLNESGFEVIKALTYQRLSRLSSPKYAYQLYTLPPISVNELLESLSQTPPQGMIRQKAECTLLAYLLRHKDSSTKDKSQIKNLLKKCRLPVITQRVSISKEN